MLCSDATPLVPPDKLTTQVTLIDATSDISLQLNWARAVSCGGAGEKNTITAFL